jgi:hypothetical protein
MLTDYTLKSFLPDREPENAGHLYIKTRKVPGFTGKRQEEIQAGFPEIPMICTTGL